MKALIVYASLTGNTEESAEILSEILSDLEVDTKVMECTQVDPDEFLNYDLCIVGTYTWGREGELPDEIVLFHQALAEVDLSGKTYGVFGSGEEAYGYFCKSADDFDKQFVLSKAQKGAETVKIEANAKEHDVENLVTFANELIKSHNTK